VRNERFEYLYAMLDTNGHCWVVRDHDTEKAAGLGALLADGWRPVRETAFHELPYVLILLEREAAGSSGFGFTGT